MDFETAIDLLVIASCFTVAGFISASLEIHLQQFNLSQTWLGFMFVIHGIAYAIFSPIFGRLCGIKVKVRHTFSLVLINLILQQIKPKFLALVGCLITSLGVVLIAPPPFFNFKP